MWELDHKWGWALKNRFFWTAVPEKSLESPLDYKEIKPVYPKGNQLWIFIGRTVAEVEAQAPILWLPDVKSQLTGKRPWCWERLRAWGEGGDRGWDGWMALLIQRTWTWANSGRWWGTRKPGVLQSTGSLRVGHNLAIEQQQIFCQTDGQHFICLLADGHLGSLHFLMNNAAVNGYVVISFHFFGVHD